MSAAPNNLLFIVFPRWYGGLGIIAEIRDTLSHHRESRAK
ncbi:hypothetical protein BRADO4025 [Bradyrhizobium sp. ORS 278]|nr:hypothetical protein BRADO4025 [Bradyrhizobium sp. ORS 278]